MKIIRNVVSSARTYAAETRRIYLETPPVSGKDRRRLERTSRRR